MKMPRRPVTASWLVALSIVTLAGAYSQASGAAPSSDSAKQALADQGSGYYPVPLRDGGTEDLELLIGQEGSEVEVSGRSEKGSLSLVCGPWPGQCSGGPLGPKNADRC